MTTRFELIAKAFPLHAQRIAECTFECGGDARLNWLMAECSANSKAAAIMSALFYFDATTEGFNYWFALQRGGGFA
ncbi:hypothetical protein [Bradyrhizobium prioriisuperbiae]|uniref:hypothetical protein n=1 Tax=Bradyrhizobium prioriisuperbiae TaxID=2854389 RepID=UPI0028E44648|nr:hypothetical protein [Bradyrhizobium prioritasuperba]